MIRTTDVHVAPFREVGAGHARAEGESTGPWRIGAPGAVQLTLSRAAACRAHASVLPVRRDHARMHGIAHSAHGSVTSARAMHGCVDSTTAACPSSPKVQLCRNSASAKMH
ncbi:hypothetical protein [Kocuria sp. 2SI]|uniref:hypothetical protein n=1 Tax=Kocuria sp. 2SI TaxID=2502203 RepID=UPI0032E4392D